MLDAVAEFEPSADVQERVYYGVARCQLLLAEGDHSEALRVAETVYAEQEVLSLAADPIKESFVLAVQAAVETGRFDKADELLSTVERLAPGLRPQFVNAQVDRFRAQLAARTGDVEEAERLFKAGGLFHELAIPFYLAVTRLEHAEWLVGEGRADEAHPLLLEARDLREARGGALAGTSRRYPGGYRRRGIRVDLSVIPRREGARRASCRSVCRRASASNGRRPLA